MATITYLCLLPFFSPAIRLMFAWNVFAWLYIIFLLVKIINRKAHDIRKITRLEDESAKMVIFFVVIGCCISVLVLFLELATAGQTSGHLKILHFIITGSTLISSWLLLPMGFTMHYAHLFYANPRTEEPWLLFPDKMLTPLIGTLCISPLPLPSPLRPPMSASDPARCVRSCYYSR